MMYEPIWSGIIACYLFLAGLGGGAFITSAFIRWRHPEAVRMRVYGHIIAPVTVIIGLLLLMFDATAAAATGVWAHGTAGDFAALQESQTSLCATALRPA